MTNHLKLYVCSRYDEMKIITEHTLNSEYNLHKETTLFGKWIHYTHIAPLLEQLGGILSVTTIGSSENRVPIHTVSFGAGPKKILIWTQMHGNESTGTKALFDFLNCITTAQEGVFKTILKECSIVCVPMLNPDGAFQYTRVNEHGIDLNRDAVDLAAKESRLLRQVLDDFQPDFCFNMHDQRTIFGVEGTENPASISFLAPSEEETRQLTAGRIKTMNVIVAMNTLLQEVIPNHIGRYTDEFYPTATGDNFQKMGYNTILIEAGHYPNDYDREVVRKFNFFALVQGVYHIATAASFQNYTPYFSIPNNQKNFFDVIESTEKEGVEKGYLYVDAVVSGVFTSTLQLEKEGVLSDYLAHTRTQGVK